MNADRKFVHDMKNMLGIIIGYSTLLLEDMRGDDPRRADVEEIRKAGESAVILLDALDKDESLKTDEST